MEVSASYKMKIMCLEREWLQKLKKIDEHCLKRPTLNEYLTFTDIIAILKSILSL